MIRCNLPLLKLATRILVWLQILDIATTWTVLSVWKDDAVEANPLAAALFTHCGLAVGGMVLLVFKLITVACIYAFAKHVKHGEWLSITATLIMAFVVVSNITNIIVLTVIGA